MKGKNLVDTFFQNENCKMLCENCKNALGILNVLDAVD